MFIGIDRLFEQFLNGKNILLVCCNYHCRQHNIQALKYLITKTKQADIIYKASSQCLRYKKAYFKLCLNDNYSMECIAGMEFNTVADCGAIEHLHPQFLSRQR